MDDEQLSTMDYAKLFLLMIIPVYGFFFTVLLAFSKDITGELKSLAKGAFIARIVFLICIGSIILFFISSILPMLEGFINKFEVIKLF